MSGQIRPSLFGAETRTATLLTIHMLTETHAPEVASLLNISLSHAQKTIASLERAGLVVGTMEGNTRRVRLNPRYFALDELKALLDKLALHDIPLQERLAQKRRRPRRSGKEI